MSALLDYRSALPKCHTSWRDDLAYILPMGIFLIFTQIGGTWPRLFAASYVAKTLIVPIALIAGWRYYTPIRWSHAWLGVIFGVLGLVQWVGMEHLLLHWWPHYPRLSAEPYNPFEKIASPGARWSFIAVRWAGASLLVPFMEELFWRDYLWRMISAPNDFKIASVGEADWKSLLLVSLLFSSVHIQWITAIVWGLMIGLLLIKTRSLGACIIMHGVTNFLLGAYVLRTGEWILW